MRVQAKLFATLRHYAPGAPGRPFEVDLAEGATVADLLRQLDVPAEEVKMVYVNARARPVDWPLEAGSEVGIFPLIGGG
ncbi:MAG: MoaD/ThiS family protein [Syntrophobacterales bacterium]|nr:MoaD/ThiS family protein [Syntrophobacterales bacterium]